MVKVYINTYMYVQRINDVELVNNSTNNNNNNNNSAIYHNHGNIYFVLKTW